MSGYAERFSRLGTAVIADAAYRTGTALGVPQPGLAPLDIRSKLAGPAVTVEANNDLVAILAAVHHAKRGDVVVISNAVGPSALMGDLIGAEANRMGLAGFVVDGSVRDVVALVDMGVKVVARGTYPVGPLKVDAAQKGLGKSDMAVAIGGAIIRPGMWVFADADGVVFLEAGDLDEVFIAAETAERQEGELANRISAGLPLGEALRLNEFLAKREADPSADFNTHLAEGDTAI